MRIRTRIIGAAMTVVAAVCVLFLSYILHKESTNAHAQLQETIAQTHQLLKVVTAGPLYDGNLQQLEANLDSFFRNPDLVEIALAEYKGDIKLSRQRAAPAAIGRNIEGRVVVTRGIDQLGEIRTVFTTANIEQRLIVARNGILLFAAAMLIAVGAVIFLVARGFTRPIDRLTEAARAMAAGDLNRTIEGGGAQELGVLAESFARMRDAIREKMADLADKNARLNQEIAERVRAEQGVRENEAALRASEQLLRSVLEQFPGTAFWKDRQSVYLGCNNAFARAAGLALPAEIVGKTDYDLPWAAAEASAYREDDRTVIESGVAKLNIVETQLQADGNIVWFNTSKVPLFDAAGQVIGVLGLSHDITERKRAEEALRHLNEELEGRVRERTAELVAAKNEAERANVAKSEFLSRMSHELRTPLNAILGFGQLMEQEPLDADQADNVKEILHAGQHLLELINEVLDLARIESGKFTVSKEPVPLMPLIAECLTLIGPQAEARGIRIIDAGCGCDQHVHADRTRLKQVLLNLLSNAVKYNRAQGTISAVCTPQGEALQIRISDTGSGLTPEQQARLFVPFERLNADNTAVEGTGIGLALSKRLIDLMDGAIGVESTPGVGSTFWLRLPAAAARADQAPAAPPAGDAGAVPLLPATRQSVVLCIEDNPANLRLVERIFRSRHDIRLITASAPGLGLELARAHLPDLILLDINLPDMDGYAVMQCLRENEATRGIPVVAISANAMPKDLERGKAAGFANYLTKPLDVGRLMQTVTAILSATGNGIEVAKALAPDSLSRRI
ncbi:MAG: ATP-binding protein [Rhodocyclaceae bacterium]